MNSDDVTLAVPCYNVADTLPQALAAIDMLDPSPSEILCVDDGSTDDTKEIIETYEDVRLIEHEQNRGLGVTLNTALAHTRTPLLAKVDADIVVPPDWLEVIYREKEESGAAFVQGQFVEHVTTTADRWRKEYPSPWFDDEPVRNKAINGANTLADTEALRDIGGWDEQYQRAFDDIDVMNRLIEAGYDVYYSPSVQTTHIRTDTWREVLRTDWAYSNHPSDGGKPDDVFDVLGRLPSHAYRSCRNVFHETMRGSPALACISLLQLPFYVNWDIKCARGQNVVNKDTEETNDRRRKQDCSV